MCSREEGYAASECIKQKLLDKDVSEEAAEQSLSTEVSFDHLRIPIALPNRVNAGTVCKHTMEEQQDPGFSSNMFGHVLLRICLNCAGFDTSSGQVESQDDASGKGEWWQGRRHFGQFLQAANPCIPGHRLLAPHFSNSQEACTLEQSDLVKIAALQSMPCHMFSSSRKLASI